ncbi:MAG TPA: winged helix-turn-helix domain-containing protein [Mycobacteriales bacterium]|nr:winged helix-turn-helix domain-containing protein [Mycobacteriales bacterium]
MSLGVRKGRIMGSLRIHFTAEDLARTRVATGPDPLWEMVLSASALSSRPIPAQYREWKDQVLGRIAAHRELGAMRTLTTLVPPASAFPDFLTPRTAYGTPDDPIEAIETIAATSADRIRADLIAVFGNRPAPGWVRELGTGSRSALRELVTALIGYYRTVLERVQQHVTDTVHADREIRARQVLDGGAESLLRLLPGPISWSRPVLRADYPADRDLYLNGRGITLIPSYFCYGRPVTLIDPQLPPVLVYPAIADAEADPPPATPDALVKLLGRTRARALTATRIACTTTELATRIDSSISMASRHAAVLSGAGLISSRRAGGAVVHSITDRGRVLLEQN